MWSILQPGWKKTKFEGPPGDSQDPGRAWAANRSRYNSERLDQLSQTLGLFSPMDAGGAAAGELAASRISAARAASPWSAER
mmetsp:Transcript_40757/g.82160  ORF Transcript_40757/g.82160 Transcript_40757/m.82160 type:complete len:82 (+) Transcript_40757:159-404(+)